MTQTIDRTPVQDNEPSRTASGIEAHRLTAFIGAELRNVNLADAANDPAVFAEINDLLLQHKVLFVRDQPISRADHVKLAERFGPLEGHPALGSDPEHPGLVRIYKDLDSPAEQYENSFHCDATWREAPPMGSVLRCVEGPAVGGDTIWVDMAQAYKRLPEHIKTQIADLRARHSIESTFGAKLPIEKRHALRATFPDAEHPVVATHPETGEKVLFVNAFTTHFTNFHTAANVRYGHDYSPGGSELLNYLIRQAYIPEYQVRWRWTNDSFAIWDNRCTQHYAVQDYFPDVRKMERAGIMGQPTV
jgi:taurine dioxygenase